MEVTVTGLNAIVSPHLHIWDWRVALYLFLGGLSAGLACMASILQVRKGGELAEGERAAVISALLVPVILSLGMLFIFLDLERKLNVYWFYLTVQPLSPMSWGSWGLIAYYPVSTMFALATIPESMRPKLRLPALQRAAERLARYRRELAAANFIMGIFIGIYTGVLLSAFQARPLWNSALLPIVFLTSALAAGAALMIMIAEKKSVKLFFTKIDIWLILAEVVMLPLYFYGQYTSTGANRDSIMPFFSLDNEFFWYGLGPRLLLILLPSALVLKFLEVTEEHSEEITRGQLMRMNLSASMALFGGLIIRLFFVYAGQIGRLT